MTRRFKREYIDVIRKRYVKSDKPSKGRILNEACALLEFHRKAFIRLINQKPKPSISILPPCRGRKKQYPDP